MANFKSQKNLISKKSEYNGYYGDFRGVDFSSDHTQVHNNRFAYLCNMYKDYRSKQGTAVETIPGFRMAFSAGNEKTDIRAIHKFGDFILVHCGTALYHWEEYPLTCGVEHSAWVKLSQGTKHVIELSEISKNNGTVIGNTAEIKAVYYSDGIEIKTANIQTDGKSVEIEAETLNDGGFVRVVYTESEPKMIISDLGSKTISVAVGNEMLLIDTSYGGHEGGLYAITIKEVNGNKYLNDPEKIQDQPQYLYVPVTHEKIITSDTNADTGEEKQQLNILTKRFKNTFVGSGEQNQRLPLVYKSEEVLSVDVQGELEVDGGTLLSNTTLPLDYYEFNENDNSVTIKGKSVGDTTFIVTARREIGGKNYVTSSTITCVHDDRIFFAGSFMSPNKVVFSDRLEETEANGIFPLFIGDRDYFHAGIEGRVSGLIPAGKNIVAVKSDINDEAGVYLFNGFVTDVDVVSRAYQKEQGVNGIECYGACANFNDDPVFLTKNGLDALGQVSVSYERALEHRSSLVDAKMYGTDMRNAFMVEFDGYLAIFANGSVFLADSRQRYTDEIGKVQYEWYYLEDIGYYDGQYQAFKYATESNYVSEETSATVDGYELRLASEEKRGTIVNPSKEVVVNTGEVMIGGEAVGVAYYVVEDDIAYICTDIGLGFIGGTFCPATCAKAIGNTIVFGAKNKLFMFNFDKRNEHGEIDPKWYTFNGRAIVSGCATKMDNCGIPHLTKTTVKKSMVAKLKTMTRSVVKIKVRTNKNPYEQVARLNNALFTFEDMEFDDYSFILTDSGLFTVREKEKKWVEKQIYLYSDELMRPFAIYYLAYRYNIAGRFKD